MPVVSEEGLVAALRDSWIGKSGQLWKLGVALVLMAIGLVCAIGAFVVGTDVPRPFGLWMIAFVFFGVLFFAWLSISIRCPFCRGPIMWWTASKTSHDLWPLTVFTLQECPYCRKSLRSTP